MKYLLIAVINLLAGLFLFNPLDTEAPALMLTISVIIILITFGIWGIVLWTKTTIRSHHDEAVDNEPLENWWKMVRAFDLILMIGLFSRFFIIQPFIVDGPSMEPNFYNKEAIMVDKITWQFRAPKRGEIAIFKAPPQPTDDYIKRIVGLPGETVLIEKGKIYIDGKELIESYLPSTGLSPDEYDQVTLNSNEYYVMGDNRLHSSDSRDWGTVPEKNLIGRASFVVYPLDKAGIINGSTK